MTAIAYTLVSPESVYPPPNSGRNIVYEHGWPNVYLIRVSDLGWEKNSSGQSGPIWSKNSALWFIYEGIQYFYIWPLLVNIVIALGLSLLVVCLWHLHCVINRKPWLFSTKEMLAVSIVLCIAFAALKTFRHKHDNEIAFLAELERAGWRAGWTNDDLPWYLRPLKELGIIKEEDYEYRGASWPGGWAENLSTAEEFAEETENINNILTNLASKQSRLWFVRDVSIADQRLDERGVQALCKLFPNCTTLYIGGYENCLPRITDREIVYLTSHLKNLQSLTIYDANLTDASVRHFAAMHKLRELAFDDKWKTTTNTSLKSLLALPYIHFLGVPAHWTVTKEEKEIIMRNGPRVDFIEN